MNENNQVLSSIQITHCVFDEIHFVRKGFKKDTSEKEVNVSVNVGHTEEQNHIVSLTLSVNKEDEYDACVKISAYCTVISHLENLEQILRENIPAIILPYARAQLTMLTAQPETEPIVLPVINVRELYKNSVKEVIE